MKKLFFITLLVSASRLALSVPPPTMTGPAAVTVGTTSYYNYDVQFVSCGYWTLSNANGTITYQDISSAQVYWIVTGTVVLKFIDGCTDIVKAQKTITISANASCPAPSTPNPTFSYSTNTCGDKTITYTGAPPSGVTWFWQTGATDISQANASNTYTAANSGTYYLRAYKSCGVWSATTFATAAVTVNPFPQTPTSTTGAYLCGPGAATISAVPGANGNSIKWYDFVNGNFIYTGSPYTTPTLSASRKYFAASFNNATGCESPSRSIVFVNVLSAPTVTDVNTCYGVTTLSATPGSGGTNVNWYASASGGNALISATSYTTPYLNSSTTYYVTTQGTSCESSPRTPITVNIDGNACTNWNESIAYGPDGLPVSDGRTYMDGFGNPIQSQSIDFVNNKVWASQPLFGSLGLAVANTLSAPLQSTAFGYKSDFVQNQAGAIYSKSDFDLPINNATVGEVNNPKPVGNAPGTLGWYYSSANNLEPKTPATSYPYSRSYTPEGPNPTTSKSAGVGENYKMGSGHESQSDRYTFGSAVLSHYGLVRPFFTASTSSLVGYMTVSTDANQRKAATFTDADGKTLATAQITTGTTPGNFQYDNWSYSFYNEVGQLVASVAPNGINTTNNLIPKFVTYYKYDQLGRLIETTSPDEGMSQFLYGTDGKIRFSQNQEQRDATPKRFSYTNYDYLGRLIESGEYESSGTNPFVFEPHTTVTPSAYSALNIIDNVGFTGITGLNDARCKETNFIQYDTPATDYPIDALHPAQTYTTGQVTKSKNDNTTTWYSYDEFGQLSTMRQALPFGQPQGVQWTNMLNVTVNGSTLTNTGGGYWEDRAFSTNSIPANTDGYLEFKAGSASSDFVMGLSQIDGPTLYTINYGIMVQSGNMWVVQNNNGSTISPVAFNLSDILRVERIGNTIFYKKNGIAFYTSTIPSSTALFADCNLNTSGSSITGISMGYSNFTGLSSVQWTNFVNVTQNGGTLTKTSGAVNAWDAGAFSIQSIPANSNGYLEFTAGEAYGTHKMMGLSSADADANYASINYAIYVESSAYIQVYENGSLRGSFGNYTTTDLLSIERQGSTIYYKKNGSIFYTSTVPSSAALFGDCSFYTPNSAINNISVKLPNGKAESLKQPLQWGSLVGLAQTGSTLTKTANTSAWGDGGAFSVQSIPANSNGWIEFMAGEANSYKMMGLSATNADANYNTINYALYPAADGRLYVYENGSIMNGYEIFSVTDVFRIERQGASIIYKKNGGVIYTSSVQTTAALYGDCSFYSPNSSVVNISLGLPTSIKTIDYTYDYFGNVTTVAYQQGQPDAFYHHYEYDKANRLTNAYTSLDGTTKTLQAKYYYYLHGPLKRVELGGNIQGIDYVYNIDGSLKLINHPDPASDPGNDGPNGFKPDIFGMSLDYTANDYVGANYNPGSLTVPSATDLYGGPVKAVRWHSQTDSHVPRAYAFGYDSKYQLATSTFGNVTGSGSYNFTPSGVSAYQENIGSYDKNGNINSLSRKNKAGTSIANFGYNYVPNTNQLASVTDNSNPLLTYQYNSIGQMTQQTEGGNTMKVSYTAYGLTKEIRDGSNNLKVAFAYDDRGNRVKKTAYNASGAVQAITYYVSDAAGNTLAIYEQEVANNGQVVLAEVPIYAAGRVGVYKPPFNSMLYEVSDHLGNVRGVVGKPMNVTVTGTYESANWPNEQQQFVRTESARRVNATLFDHTKTVGASYSQRLNGSANEKYGIARPIAVLPGDVINAEVFVKYVDPVSSNWNTALTTLMTQISANTAGVVVDGAGYANPSTFPYVGLNGTSSSTGTGPKAYLNWLVFDKNYAFNPSLSGYMRMSTAAKEAGTNVVHERLYSPSITVTEPGYVYVYISNEELIPLEVYFDDFKVTQNMSDIVAGADYYPFGLPILERELTREPYRYGYQGQYSEKDKETGFNFFDLRMYDSRIARWVVPDPYGQFKSSYLAMGNSPVSSVDPDGGYSWLGHLWRKVFIGGPYTPANGYLGRSLSSSLSNVGKKVMTKAGKLLAENPGIFSGLANAALNSQKELKVQSAIDENQKRFDQLKGLMTSTNNSNCCPWLWIDAAIVVAQSPAAVAVTTQVATRTAPGWVAALGEPTPIGEAVMGVGTVLYTAYCIYEVTKGGLKVHYQKTGVVTITAREWIAEKCKGSVLREFPEEYLDWTLDQIKAEAQKGNKKAKKAWKLLNDKRFRK